MIKDLSLHCCILQFSAFECKKILRLDVFTYSLLETWCLQQTSAFLLYKSSPYSPLLQLTVWSYLRPHLPMHAWPSFGVRTTSFLVNLHLITSSNKLWHKLMGVGLCSCCNPGVTSDANISGAVAGDEVENLPWDWMTLSFWFWRCIRDQSAWRLLLCTWWLHCDESTVAKLLF